MRELRDILDALRRLPADGPPGVLASLVRAEGSTYRRPGARMLLLPDDRLVGLIGGGCLEGDLLAHAKRVRETGEPARVRYDSRGEDDIVWGLGLGCAGVVEVLLERVAADALGPLGFLEECLRARRPGVLCTVTAGEGAGAPPLGARLALRADGRAEADPALARTRLAAHLEERARHALATGRPERLREGGVEALVEPVPVVPRLLVFGAGPDARPLVRYAAELGWEARVLDARPAYARADRFPEAAQVVCREPARLAGAVSCDARTAALVMTHHYLHDRDVLRGLVGAELAYLGVLGPKRRTEDLLCDLREEGVEVSEEARERIFGPAGLDIGADAPHEIALALVAEIQAVLAGRPGGWLRERKGPIHDPAP